MSTTNRGFRYLAMAVLTLVVGATFTVGGWANSGPAEAAGFDPANIISDAVFFDKNAMTEGQIQTFLEARVPTCQSSSGPGCLKDYRTDSYSRGSQGNGHCAAYEGAANERASRVIYKVAQACGISPRVLLVTLQKEQSLVADTSPAERQYKVAMGFGCPDTAPCDTQFYGFYNQVYKAAWQFRQYTLKPSQWRYRVGNTAVQYHPNASCGSSIVNIQNQATANLYNYTPYQPNASALAAGWGTGDACGAYGNRNFWLYFNAWFGAATQPVSPLGNLEVADTTLNTATFRGWTFDPDTDAPIDVHLYVNDNWGGSFTANQPRQDIALAYPSYGPNHGFDITVPVGRGTFSACLYAINVGAQGVNQQLGCRTLSTPGGPPIGSIDSAKLEGSNAILSGWVIDPDSPESLDVHVYVNGAWGGAFRADASREDVGKAYDGYGTQHGYRVSVPLPVGTSDVCVFGINVGEGFNKSIGCAEVSTASGPPFGNTETATSAIGKTTLTGWAIDPDTADSIDLHVYVNGGWGGAYRADSIRQDVGSAYPGYGNSHGFNIEVPTSGGRNEICVFGINERLGYNQSIGCKTVNTPTGAPYGSVDSISVASGTGDINGWAIDPDSTAPVGIHVYVNGAWGGEYVADGRRADVGLVYPKYGENHGFTISLGLPKGSSEVCTYAINVGGGHNQLISCRAVFN